MRSTTASFLRGFWRLHLDTPHYRYQTDSAKLVLAAYPGFANPVNWHPALAAIQS
jgi:hypothetical protein